MPLAYRYACNEDIKRLLRKHKITYQALAATSWYSVGTIAQWMCHPMNERQRTIILQAIETIVKTLPPPAIDPSCCNHAIRTAMLEYDITYTELARKVGVAMPTIWGWIVYGEMSSQKKELVENAITEIKEERRLSHAD